MGIARQMLRGIAIGTNVVGVVLYMWFLWMNGFTGGLYNYIEILEIFVPAIAVVALLNSKAN